MINETETVELIAVMPVSNDYLEQVTGVHERNAGMTINPPQHACPICGKHEKRRWYLVDGRRVCGHCVGRRMKRPDGGRMRPT